MKHRPHTYRAAAVRRAENEEAQGLASLQASADGAVCIIQTLQPCLGREQIADDRMMSTNVGIERSTCLVMHGPNKVPRRHGLALRPAAVCSPSLAGSGLADPPMILDSRNHNTQEVPRSVQVVRWP